MITTGQDAPSSSDSFLTPARAAMRSPMPVEPVNDTFRTRGSATSRSPSAPPGPVSTDSTPSGSPASTKHAASASAVSGVVRAGLRTTAFPAASAGRDLVQHQQRREVERGDRDDDADRLADGEADLVEAGALVRVQRQRVAVELGALERREPDEVARAARLRRRLGDRLAVLGADRRGDLRRALVGELRRPAAGSASARGPGCAARSRRRARPPAGRARRPPDRPWGPRPRRSRRTASGPPRSRRTGRPSTGRRSATGCSSTLSPRWSRRAGDRLPLALIGSFRTLRRHAATFTTVLGQPNACDWTVQETLGE